MFNPHDPNQVNVRVSGTPGVRVTQTSMGSLTQHKRASNVPDVGAVRSIPIERLALVRDLLTGDATVRPADSVIREVHELLEPWL
jgi:hypothetical protein